MQNAITMTKGSESKHIIKFALPLLLGNLLQQTYNIADTLIVSKFLGDDALAAVGSTGSITYLFYTLCIGLSIGSGIIVSQLLGMNDLKRLKSAVFNSAIVTAIFGVSVSILSVILAKPALILMNVPDKLLDNAVIYMQISCAGTVAVAAYNWINGVMRALGDSKSPLIFLSIATVLNVILDLLFVAVFDFGTGGAAAATIMAQGFSALLCIIYCFKTFRELKLSKFDMKFSKNMAEKCIKSGIPIAVQNGLISVSMIALQRVTNSFGETVMAAYTVSMRIEQFIQQPFSSLNAAISTFTGQNIGAGKKQRAINGLRAGMLISLVFAFIMLFVFIIFGKNIVAIFVSSKDVIAIGASSLIITGCFYWALGGIHTIRGFLNGTGDTGYALVNGAAEVICRIVFSLILTKIAFISYWGIWVTTAITWFATAAVSFMRYKSRKWESKAIT